jgi:quercetin dioxygenase-like cupin family protein
MGIEKVFAGGRYQVLKAELPAGGVMPEHYATSDAFVIIVKGKAEIIFENGKSEISGGGTFLIPEKRPHRLEIRENFEAYILLASGATIEGAAQKEIKLQQEPA